MIILIGLWKSSIVDKFWFFEISVWDLYLYWYFIGCLDWLIYFGVRNVFCSIEIIREIDVYLMLYLFLCYNV